MDKKYDVIIVGAGPAGIFTAYELTREHPELRILMLEKGRDIYKRKCPKHTNGGTCVHCKPCSITTGWAGAGAFSDGKLSLSHEVGGTLPEYIGVETAMEMIRYTDDIYLKFGADTRIHGLTETLSMREIRRKSIEANLKLVQCPVSPGLASDETLLYGVEVKFYSNIVKVDKSFQSTSVKNLYFGGDGAGITRGLMQASVNGVLIAREILNNTTTKS